MDDLMFGCWVLEEGGYGGHIGYFVLFIQIIE
jgi:hypothetical protein